MANEENLIKKHPFDDPELARRAGQAGKGKSYPKKQWAARLRELKRKGMNSESCDLLTQMILERESFALDILLVLKKLQAEAKTEKQKLDVTKVLTELMKSVHPKESSSINLDLGNKNLTQINISIEKYDGNKREDKGE